jgi:hypothetical protein
MTVAVCFVFGVMVTKVNGKDIVSQDSSFGAEHTRTRPRVGNLNPTLRPHSHWQDVVGKEAVIYACHV